MAFITPLNQVQESTFAERCKVLVIAFRCCLHFHWRPLLIEMSSSSLPSLHRWPTSPRSSYETFWLRFCSKGQKNQIYNSILFSGIIQFCSLSAFKILNEYDKCCIFWYVLMWKHKADVSISWIWLIWLFPVSVNISIFLLTITEWALWTIT